VPFHSDNSNVALRSDFGETATEPSSRLHLAGHVAVHESVDDAVDGSFTSTTVPKMSAPFKAPTIRGVTSANGFDIGLDIARDVFLKPSATLILFQVTVASALGQGQRSNADQPRGIRPPGGPSVAVQKSASFLPRARHADF
jgi:hypothetical protein